jgi:hypothetical protein
MNSSNAFSHIDSSRINASADILPYFPPGSQGWLCIFSPDTLLQAVGINFAYACFTLHRAGIAKRISPGDLLFPYVTGSRVLRGVLRAISKARVDSQSSIYGSPGSYPVLVECEPLLLLDSITEIDLSQHLGSLGLFRGLKNKDRWASSLRVSPRSLSRSDTVFLYSLVMKGAS